MNFTTCISNVRFDVSFSWPKCDVDAVYAEIGGMFQGKHSIATNRTPVSARVQKVLHDILCNCHAYWQSLGVDAKATDALMMGCASVTFETTPDKYNPELIKRIKTDCQRMMVAGVRYYKEKTVVGHSIGMGSVTHG